MKETNNLSKEDIINFYKFICQYERSVKKEYGKFDFNNKEFQRFCKDNKIAPKNGRSKLPYIFSFQAHQDEKTKINDMAHHMLRHFRNAFAHGLITKNGSIYYFEDYSTKGNQTMDGHIRADLFWSFLEKLIATKC